MKLYSLNFFNLINFLLILIIITTNYCTYTLIHSNDNNNNRKIQKYNSLTQTMFLSELKKLNVYLLEEESIGREVANLQFPINRMNNSNENYLINHNHNDNNEEEEEGQEVEEEKEEKRKKSNYYQIFNSEPQSKYFHLDAKTGIIRVARRIDRDQLCPLFKSCCTYLNHPNNNNNNINYFNKNFNLINNEQLTNCQLDLNIRSDDQYTNIITVSVHIIDINDNSPIWLLNSKSGLLNFPDDHQKQVTILSFFWCCKIYI